MLYVYLWCGELTRWKCRESPSEGDAVLYDCMQRVVGERGVEGVAWMNSHVNVGRWMRHMESFTDKERNGFDEWMVSGDVDSDSSPVEANLCDMLVKVSKYKCKASSYFQRRRFYLLNEYVGACKDLRRFLLLQAK